MKILDMRTLHTTQLTQAAQILTNELPLGWTTFEDAMEEINTLLTNEPGAVLLAAVENDDVIGWCGILPQYNGNAYELHPLVVCRNQQGKGVGTALMDAITKCAKDKGGLTLFLGADDEAPGGETSFANVDLYNNLPKHIQEFDPGAHQSVFYIKLGFKVVGVVPDANGKGKPDIILAKQL